MVAVREGISGTGTATEGFGSSKGTGSVEAVEIFEDTGGEILTVVDTGTVWDTETADGTVGDAVTAEDTGTGTVGVAVETRRSSWRRWGKP